jgi:hypothetical protein
MDSPFPTVSLIAQEQLHWTQQWHVEEASLTELGSFLRLVAENHLRNFKLWHEEDLARRDDLGAEPVRDAKRAIDRFNQQRNDFIEQMDRALVEVLKPRAEGCPFISETPGMMIDRLSILALKDYHMQEQVDRKDVASEHRAACLLKLNVIRRQRADLTDVLEAFLDEVVAGSRSFRVYFQFKMYNDPALNPQLYAGRKS